MGVSSKPTTVPTSDTVIKCQVLPDSYTTVPAVALKESSVAIPEPANVTTEFAGKLVTAMKLEQTWLDKAINLLHKEKLEKVTVLHGLPIMHLRKMTSSWMMLNQASHNFWHCSMKRQQLPQ